MTIISIFLVYLLFLSLHACNARHPILTEFNGVTLSKDGNEMILHKSLIPNLKVRASLSKELSKQQKRVKIKVTRGRAHTKKPSNGSTGGNSKNGIEDSNGTIAARLSRKRHNSHPDPRFSLDYAPPLTHPHLTTEIE